jgi:hypothetical protein
MLYPAELRTHKLYKALRIAHEKAFEKEAL